MTDIKPDVVVHLAAVSHANKSNKTPHDTFDHSLRTLQNTLDFSKNNIAKLLYVGNFHQYVTELGVSSANPGGILSDWDSSIENFNESKFLPLPMSINACHHLLSGTTNPAEKTAKALT